MIWYCALAGTLDPEFNFQYRFHEIGVFLWPICALTSKLRFVTVVVPKGGAGDHGGCTSCRWEICRQKYEVWNASTRARIDSANRLNYIPPERTIAVCSSESQQLWKGAVGSEGPLMNGFLGDCGSQHPTKTQVRLQFCDRVQERLVIDFIRFRKSLSYTWRRDPKKVARDGWIKDALQSKESKASRMELRKSNLSNDWNSLWKVVLFYWKRLGARLIITGGANFGEDAFRVVSIKTEISPVVNCPSKPSDMQNSKRVSMQATSLGQLISNRLWKHTNIHKP